MYQKKDDNSDSETEYEEEATTHEEPPQTENVLEKTPTTPVKKKNGHPLGKKNAPKKEKILYIEPDKVKEAILENKIQLTSKQQKSLVNQIAPVKRNITEERKEQLREWGKLGREKAKQNRELKRLQQEQEQEEKNKSLIKVVKPLKKKRVEKVISKTPPQDLEINYPDETTDGETTDTRSIRKTKEKLQLIRSAPKTIEPPKRLYKDLSILEKLNSKF